MYYMKQAWPRGIAAHVLSHLLCVGLLEKNEASGSERLNERQFASTFTTRKQEIYDKSTPQKLLRNWQRIVKTRWFDCQL